MDHPAAAVDRPTRADDRRVAVLRAAVAVALGRGYHGTTYERVARAADVDEADVRHEFSDTVELLTAAFELARDEWYDQMPAWRDLEPAPDVPADITRRLLLGVAAGSRAAAFWRLGLVLRLEPALNGVDCCALFDDVRAHTREVLHDFWASLMTDQSSLAVDQVTAGHLSLIDGAVFAGAASPQWDLDRLMTFASAGIVAAGGWRLR